MIDMNKPEFITEVSRLYHLWKKTAHQDNCLDPRRFFELWEECRDDIDLGYLNYMKDEPRTKHTFHELHKVWGLLTSMAQASRTHIN